MTDVSIKDTETGEVTSAATLEAALAIAQCRALEAEDLLGTADDAD